MKLIELADLHINPKWLESQKPVLQTIVDTGKNEKPNFFCIAGDIYDRPFYNSDKDCIGYVRRFMRNLLNIATVVIVPGTPAHDAPGSYGIFEEMGCSVLHPAKPKIINDVLFIGLPEIDKSSFMAKNKMSMEDANIQIQQGIDNYIQSYWVPIREANKNIPCVFLGHGWFVDNVEKARNNPMIKNADFIIDNNILKEIKADRYIFGHCHTPSESKILNGGYVGYAGFDRTPWNNTGFQPGFNVTEIKYKVEPDNIYVKNIERIPYPVVRKEKFKMNCLSDTPNSTLFKNSKNCDVRINLKINKSDLVRINIRDWEYKFKNDFSLNSCEIVPDIIKEESQRITKEQADKLNTFWKKYCFFKGWEENSHESVMKKSNEVEKNVSSRVQQVEKKVVKLLSLEVKGSIFSKKSYDVNCLYHDFSKDPTGPTLIQGKNGGCKSTYFGFCPPYPVFIGFDYRSLKDFFPNGGHIKKKYSINEIIHEHIIQIPQDHKKKILCYWNIKEMVNETPDWIWKSKFKEKPAKEFMAECEKFFGPITSFISTSFFAQEPWRMKKYISSLVSSTETELRNAYMEIIGISREQEKEYAHDKVKELKSKIHDLELKKNTMSEILADKETVKDECAKLKSELNELEQFFQFLFHDKFEKQKEFDKIDKEYKEQQKIEDKIKNEQLKLYNSNCDKENINEKIRRLGEINIDELKKQLKDNTEKINKIDFLRDQWQDINKEKEKIQDDINKIENKKKNYILELEKTINAKNILFKNIDSLINQNKILNTECFYCGKIDPENEKEINKNTTIIEADKETINAYEKIINDLQLSYTECDNEIIKQKEKLPTEQLKSIENQASKLKQNLFSEEKIQAINNSIAEYSQIKIYQKNLETIKSDIKKTNEIIETLESKKNPFTEPQYNKISNKLSELQNQLQEKQKEISSKEGMLIKINEELEKINKFEKEITEILKKLDILVVDFDEWEMFEKDMMPHKFPALELQLIAEEIDFEVNKKLAGKFIIKTNTQDINKNGDIIDRFSITVYDPISGIEDSLLNYSPGERSAFFIEPISQALREKRQQRENIQFMWSVADETDNFIKYDVVREYYEIMSQGLPEGHTRFIMSQKSEIYQFIKNTIDIEQVGKNI